MVMGRNGGGHNFGRVTLIDCVCEGGKNERQDRRTGQETRRRDGTETSQSEGRGGRCARASTTWAGRLAGW